MLASGKLDDLRRQASDLLETLLAAFGTNQSGVRGTDESVPLLTCSAPVSAGASARASFRVCNEEATPSDVSFYASNFVSDSGYEIPSLRMSITPRRVNIAPGGEAVFELQIAVPNQAPPGLYSGLAQATGSKYVKAVIMFEVF